MIRSSLPCFLQPLALALALPALAAPLRAEELLSAEYFANRVQSAAWPGGGPGSLTINPVGVSANPFSVRPGPDGMLYVAVPGLTPAVARFFPDGSPDPSFVLPSSGNLVMPTDVAFHPSTGVMYVSDFGSNRIVPYNLNSGTVGTPIPVSQPTFLSFGGGNMLYVSEGWNKSVLEIDTATGNVGPFVLPGAGGLATPAQLAFDANEMYVANGANVLRFSALTGAYLGVEAPTGSEIVGSMFGVAVDSQGDVYVSNPGGASIEKYKPHGAGRIGTFCGAAAPVGLAFFDADRPAPFPVRAREVVATFCPDLVFPGVPNPIGACVKLVDARSGGPTGTNWTAPMFSNDVPNPLAPDAWTYANLGPVFATAIDDQPAPNIFVAATSAYGTFPFGPGGGGAVYKLEGCDGSIDPWIVTGPPALNDNKLPNASGVGLGDICYDRAHDQFFVSNLDDGIIYCFKDLGTKAKLIASFDPFGSNLVAGLPPLGDRIWGLHVYDDPYTHNGAFGKLLIFSVWLRDTAHKNTPWPIWLLPYLPPGPPPPANNALFSVQLSPTGAILPASVKLLRIMPYLSATKTYSNPVSDITSCTRYVLTAEKTMWGPGIPGVLGHSHEARTLRFQLSSGLPLIDVYRVGDIGGGGYVDGASSAGGVAVDQLLQVWSTGDAIQYPGYTLPSTSDYVYGLQRFAWKGNSTLAANTWSSITKLIDLDHNVSVADKSQPGDVEVVPFNASMINCPSTGGGGGAGHL